MAEVHPERSRRFRAFVWLLSIVAAVFFAAAGGAKLGGSPVMLEAFARYGFPEWFVFMVGVGEVLCAVALLLRPIAFLGALGLLVIVVGALVTHIASGDPFARMLPAVLFLIILPAIAWLRGRDFLRAAERYVH